MPKVKRSSGNGLRAATRKKKARDLLIAILLGLAISFALGGLIWFMNWQQRP